MRIKTIHLPEVKEVEDYFLYDADHIEEAIFPNLEIAGVSFLACSMKLRHLTLPSLIAAKNGLLEVCFNLEECYLPVLRHTGRYSFSGCRSLRKLYVPKLDLKLIADDYSAIARATHGES